jgi:exopolyphosphatase/guanosine-5'-triphosphate,3'-diphosphate pyrophosphatase
VCWTSAPTPCTCSSSTPIPAPGRRIERRGADDLVRFVAQALEWAEDQGAEDLLAFATSAIREAPNGREVLARVREEADVDLQVLTGDEEARLTFLAVRRWFGWSAGRLLVIDIGGGSLEMATGADEEPDVALSLPLGAGRLTHDELDGDPPPSAAVKAVRKKVRAQVATAIRDLTRLGAPDRVVGTSKTLRSLARVAGAAPSSAGAYEPRHLTRDDLAGWVPRLASMSAAERAHLPGVSPGRAPQLLAGAVVAHAAMDLLDVEELQICPWALREGIILRRLDWISAG